MISLEPEVRCDHLVTTETKKLWRVEMDCFEVVKKICQEHNIKYFASGGTLLGAVRHKGYIPWDDDIDLFMLPEDYRRFCEIAPKVIEKPYFFQHYSTQAGTGINLCRIRNSETTGCTAAEYEQHADTPEHNCGIFVDVFPIVYAGDTTLQKYWHKAMMYIARRAIDGHHTIKALKRKGAFSIKHCFQWNIILRNLMHLFADEQTFFRRISKACDMFPSGKMVGLLPMFSYREKFMWPSECFEESIELPFEDTTISCPKDYDTVLRRQYGDYMVFEKGTAIHSFAITDPDTPYYIKLQDHYKQMQQKG